MKPVEPLLEAGAQVQQMLTAECLDDYIGNYFENLLIRVINMMTTNQFV